VRDEDVGVDAVDHDELLAAPGAGHDPDIALGDPEVLGDELDEGVVGGSLHGGRPDPRPEHPVHDTVDVITRSPGGETDSEADV
jgi:hypothetical protein